MRQVLTRLTRSDAVMALRLLLVDFYTPKAYKTERDEAWESIPGLPGEHLRWHQTARGRSEIVTEDGRVLATVEGGFGAKLPRRMTIGQVTYQVRGGLFNPPRGSPRIPTVGHRARWLDRAFLYRRVEFRPCRPGSRAYAGWAVAAIPSSRNIDT
jgi:hypothetical protein